jgi:hypothetical protein
MQIVEWRRKQGFYTGEAISRRGRHYRFGVSKAGEVCWIDRLEPFTRFWLDLGTRRPMALIQAVRSHL